MQALDLPGNVPLTHAAGIQGQNFILHIFGIAVILADDFRFVVI